MSQELSMRSPSSKLIFHSGVYGGGSGLAGIIADSSERFGIGNVLVLPSPIYPKAFYRGDSLFPAGYSAEKAREMNQWLVDDSVLYAAHSSGGWDGLRVAQAMLEQGYRGDLHMMLFNVPGIENQGLELPGFRGLVRVARLLSSYTQYGILGPNRNQNTIYPLPEEYHYHQPCQPKPAGVDIYHRDNSAQRRERRERFEQDWLPNLVPDDQKRIQLITDLQQIDREIELLYQSGDHKALKGHVRRSRLMRRRLRLLSPFQSPLNSPIFSSQQLDQETQDHLAVLFDDHGKKSISKAKFTALAGIYLARWITDVSLGISQGMAQVARLADENGASVDYTVVLYQLDPITPPNRAREIRRSLAQCGISDRLVGVIGFEGYGHDLAVHNTLLQAIDYRKALLAN